MSDSKQNIATRLLHRSKPTESVSATIQPTVQDHGREEPRGVGVCLSGGGSRAMTAGLGQLRALHHLHVDGASLLSRVAVLSTVSGGSWLGVPWTFLPASVTDNDFLGEYVPDPRRLVTCLTEGHSAAETLDVIGVGNPGGNIGHDFSIFDMILDVVALRLVHGTPYNSMWQIIMGRRLLGPYGLYVADDRGEPTSMFTADRETERDDIVGPNPKLADHTIHLRADVLDADRPQRPLLICNTALFVSETDETPGHFEFLAPVQITPTTAGVVSSPRGVNSVGAPVGGGTVSSFAFGSALASVEGDDVSVLQDRQLSLEDIVGMSSAAFAEFVEDFDDMTKGESKRQHRKMLRRRMQIERALGEHPRHRRWWTKILDDLKAFAMHFIARRLDPKDLVPRYRYWPVRDATPDEHVPESRFADGGSLENTGIASMLTRTGIDRIMSCVNSPDPLAPARFGIVSDDAGTVSEEPGTRVKVSSELPFLFGYRAYNDEVGYERFGRAADHDLGSDLMFKHNQVFDSKDFGDLLRGLAKASSSAGNADLHSKPAIFSQCLTTVDNPWFGVCGGREVTVVWVYLNDSTDWRGLLSDEVNNVVNATSKFPNYSTEHTELGAIDVNLLSHFTAWSIANDDNSQTFLDLFT